MNGETFLRASKSINKIGNDIVVNVNRIIKAMNIIGVENLPSIKFNKSCNYTTKAGDGIIMFSEIAKDIGERFDNTNERTGMVL